MKAISHFERLSIIPQFEIRIKKQIHSLKVIHHSTKAVSQTNRLFIELLIFCLRNYPPFVCRIAVTKDNCIYVRVIINAILRMCTNTNIRVSVSKLFNFRTTLLCLLMIDLCPLVSLCSKRLNFITGLYSIIVAVPWTVPLVLTHRSRSPFCFIPSARPIALHRRNFYCLAD